MKMWTSLKLTFYYGICLTIVNGKVVSSKQKSLPSYHVTDNVLSENHNTLSTAKLNPRKSDLVRDSDKSDKTVLSNGIFTNAKNIFHFAEGVMNGKNDRKNIRNLQTDGLLGNTILNTAKQITLGHEAIPSSNMALTTSRVRRSVDLGLSPYALPLRRFRRGFRSGVADRIAHGFGKRTPGLNLNQSNFDRLRNVLGQVHLGRAQDLLSLQPEDLEEIDSLLAVYDNMLGKLQKSNDRYGELTENKDTLSEIYKKLSNELQDSRFINPIPFPDESFDSRRYR